MDDSRYLVHGNYSTWPGSTSSNISLDDISHRAHKILSRDSSSSLDICCVYWTYVWETDIIQDSFLCIYLLKMNHMEFGGFLVYALIHRFHLKVSYLLTSVCHGFLCHAVHLLCHAVHLLCHAVHFLCHAVHFLPTAVHFLGPGALL